MSLTTLLYSLSTPPKPYWVVFPIPLTDLILEVHLSPFPPFPPSPPLPPNSIPILLDVAHDVAEQQIQRHGVDSPLPRNLSLGDLPEFDWETGTGVRILVRGKSQWHTVTWGMLRDVLGGLRLYLRDGRERSRVKFRFRVVGERSWRGWGEIGLGRDVVRVER